MNINVKDHKIEEIFGNTEYHIDFYQRDYKWSIEHVETLLEDIFFKFENDYKEKYKCDTSTVDEKYSWYYLNTYVTHTQRGKEYIVDGQQRFTTLTLILLKLFHTAKKYELNNARIDYIKKRIYDAGADGYSFWMGTNNREKALEDLLTHGNKTLTEYDNDISISNMFKNYEFIEKYIDEKLTTARLVDSFVLYFLRKVIIVEIKISDSNDIAMVFEVINARGEKLKPYEILKGELLGQLDKDELEEYLSIWLKSIKVLQDRENDPDRFVENFFISLLRSRYATKIGELKEIDKDYHKAIFSKKWDKLIHLKRNPKRVKEFLKNDFDYYTKKYDSFFRHFNESSTFPFIYFNTLNGLGSQYLLLLSCLKINDDNESNKIKLVSKLIDRHFSLTQLMGSYNNNKFTDSVRIITIRIRNSDTEQIKEIFDEELLNLINSARNTDIKSPFYYPFFKETGYNNLNYTFLRYFFARIEGFIGYEINQSINSYRNLVKNTGRVNGYHIEHILSNNEFNLAIFDNEEEFLRERNRLGSLLLINSNVNVASGAEEYQNKLKTYSHETLWARTLTEDFHHKHPPFANFSKKYKLEILPISKFDKQAVEQRQKQLFEIAKIIWSDDKMMN